MDFSKLRNYLFLGLLLGATVMFVFLLRPFAYPLFWAAVAAAIFYPFYLGLNRYLKRSNLSSFITLCLVTIIIIFPLTFASALLINESASLYNSISDKQGEIMTSVKHTIDYLNHQPLLTKVLHQEQLFNQDTITEKIATGGAYLLNISTKFAINFTQNSFTFVVMFVIMLYTLFYFLKDGEKMLKKAMFLLPLGDKYEKILYKKFTSTARAALKGTLVIGVMQGVLGGILMAIAGVPGAFIWAIVMIILSVIPATSSTIVLIPTGVIMLIMGRFGAGLLLVIGGGLISVLDNFVRPMLIGNDLQMHPLLILFSTIGGIAFFGISGFIIGPIIAAFFLSLWEMYEHYYFDELANDK